MNKTRKIIVALVGLIIVALIAGALLKVPSASAANPFATFWSDLTHPFTAENPATVGSLGGAAVSESSSTGLYQPADQYEADVMAAVQKASPAVVSITISENVPVVENCPYNPFSDLPQQFQQLFGNGSMTVPCDSGQTQLQAVGGGSGFIISSDGLILTNKHVVSDTNAQYSVLTNDGKTYTATVLARDPDQDLAVLKISATNLPTVTLGNSDSLQLGQTAIAIGNALGQFSNTVSVGAVSGLGRTVTASAPDTGAQETISGVIQTDAAINPGNSGGPLLDLRGDVIGIDTAVASDAQNIGFAIPINEAKAAISSVESTGAIQAPYLGVEYEDVTPAIATANKLPITYGAWVSSGGSGSAVMGGSPAAKAGIQAGDIIESVNGVKLDTTHDLANVINEYSVGTTVTLVVNRKGQEITLQATLAQRPAGT
ncbi:MAG TPA: trypsin-like peptidase domain-containing protein [Candidatus Paceibacterota bacterium]|nr:trypsin-like peptidase domain-containing protein [Candidatus Paceibacterota bacterium]